MVALNFSARTVQPNLALEALPSGQYPVAITKSESKPTKKGDGSYIELELTVQPGHQYAGRKFYDRLNTQNPNPQAVEIAFSTLSAICHVTNRMDIQDTQQLHGIPFIAVVTKKPRGDQNPPPIKPEDTQYTNEVKGYKDINGNDPGSAGNPAGPQGGGQPVWANNGGGQPPSQAQGQAAPSAAGYAQQQPQGQQGYAPQPQPQQGYAPQPQGGQPAWAPQSQQGQVPQQQVQPVQQPAQQQPVQQQQAPVQVNPGDVPPWLAGQQQPAA